MTRTHRDGAGATGPGSEASGDFQRAVNRLESAVQDFVSTAGDTVSDRAAGLVEDAAERLEQEIGTRRRRRGRHTSRRRRRRTSSPPNRDFAEYRTRRLYRDDRNGKLGGICAGLARYFGVETWVVRCIALTGLIFMGQVVVPAYLIAWIVLEKAPDVDAPLKRASGSNNSRTYNSPAPELGPNLSPRRGLRDTQADLDQLELKLRRMEKHVTSGQYELQREFNRIDT